MWETTSDDHEKIVLGPPVKRAVFDDASSRNSALNCLDSANDKVENLIRQMSENSLGLEAVQDYECCNNLPKGSAKVDQLPNTSEGAASMTTSAPWILPPPKRSAVVTPSTPACLQEPVPALRFSLLSRDGSDTSKLEEFDARVSRLEVESAASRSHGEVGQSDSEIVGVKQQLRETQVRLTEVETKLSQAHADILESMRHIGALERTLELKSPRPTHRCTPALEQVHTKPRQPELSHTPSTVSITSSVSLGSVTPYIPAPLFTARVHRKELLLGQASLAPPPFLSARGTHMRVR